MNVNGDELFQAALKHVVDGEALFAKAEAGVADLSLAREHYNAARAIVSVLQFGQMLQERALAAQRLVSDMDPFAPGHALKVRHS